MNTWKIPQITTVLSVLAFCVSSASLAISKLSYDLSIAKDEREIQEKQPAVDVQLVPAGVASANVTISIINRGDINVAPYDITALPSLEAGEFYFSSSRQSVDKLKWSLSLRPMGSIAPKSNAVLKATLSGVTDGKDDPFINGVELQLVVRVQVADKLETMKTVELTRHVRR